VGKIGDGSHQLPIEKLNAKFVQNARTPGLYGDGRGLWLRVTTPDQRSWVYRYTLRGKAHEMGLGSVLEVPLVQARKRAAELRLQRSAGNDPLAHKRTSRATAREVVTFKEAAKRYIDSHRASWKSPKHLHQWNASLATYAFRHLGDLPVDTIDTPRVVRTLEEIWTARTETASRVRGRIELILNWCTVRGYRSGENPARWRGHLDALLPKPGKVAKKKRHASMPYADVPGFFRTLGDSTADRALAFVILTASRLSEVVDADWREIQGDTWIIPGSRIKAGKEHRVPLCARAIQLLGPPGTGRIFDVRDDALWRRARRAGATVHGFRSSFRDWAAERTTFPREIAELSLAHAVGSAVERAYQRSDLLDKRRDLMTRWAAFCTG
jgi:integrase